VDVLLAVGCETDQAVDVMLILDRSGSMEGDKLVNAKESAIAFLNQMNLNVDQVGLVSFAGSAVLNRELTEDGIAVEDTINNLTVSGSTNIADALAKAGEELNSRRSRPDNVPVIVLLTDGDYNAGGDPLDVAQSLKSDGIEIYTIGLGSDVEADTLRAIASSPDAYFESPTTADLATIYNEVAVTVGCGVLADSRTVYLPIVLRAP
jgi:Mg-chelatase subunit ChlD